MKTYLRIFSVAILILSFCVGSAQSKNPRPFLNVGPEINWSLRNNHEVGIGVNVKYGLPVSTRSSFTLISGINWFEGKTIAHMRYSVGMGYVPIRAGLKYNIFKTFYLEPQVGYSRVFFEKGVPQSLNFGALNYAFNAGLSVGKHWDFSVKYEGFTNHKKYQYNFHSAGIRIAYNINWKKK